jgi:hypothetical protein
MSVRRKIAAASSAIRELGFLNGGGYLVDALLAAASKGRVRIRKYYFVAQAVRREPWLPGKRGSQLEVRRVFPEDSLIERFPRPREVMPYRFQQEAICLAALKEGHFVGFLWFTLGPYREDEVRCRYVPLPPGRSAWDFDVFLEPLHRSGIAFLKLWDEANRFLAARDVHWSLSRISAFNRHSLMSHMRMGATLIGTALFLSAGSVQLCLSTRRPFLHLSLHQESFPTFALDPEKPEKRKPRGEAGFRSHGDAGVP